MIQKRYQYYDNNGIQWTDWFNWDENNEKLSYYQKKEPKQPNKLLNEYRISKD